MIQDVKDQWDNDGQKFTRKPSFKGTANTERMRENDNERERERGRERGGERGGGTHGQVQRGREGGSVLGQFCTCAFIAWLT